MKRIFIVGNWKSNKTEPEAKEWIQHLTSKIDDLSINNKEVIICPPFTLLPILRSYIIDHKLPISLGAQDISPFDEGAFTGEVNGKQIKEFADYVIIGHSERKKYFPMDKEMFKKQINMAKQYTLKTIYCASDENDFVPDGATLIVYEPPSSISPGPADNPENAERAALLLCQKYNVEYVLYGGNVTSENVKTFILMPHIFGVLVGRASLDPVEFSKIIKNA